MTSVLTNYAQRNNNVTQIIPQLLGPIPDISGTFFDLSNVSCYVLNLPAVQNTGGVYFVDLNGVDTDGNLLNIEGLISSMSDLSANNINFGINVPFNASYAPGLEFTIFFKNLPYDRLFSDGPAPLFTIGIVALDGAPFPYMLSPPLPVIFGPAIYNSVTFKSDGTNYNIVSAGPAGWLGDAAFALLLSFFGIGGPFAKKGPLAKKGP